MLINELSRSECGSDSSVAKVTDGNEPFHVRSMRQGVSEGPEPATASEGAQLAVEAEAESERGSGEEEGVRVSGEELRAQRP